MSSRRGGFTLIEAVVGVTIAAVLATGFYLSMKLPGSSTSAAEDAAERAATAAASLFDIVNAMASLETTNPPTSFRQTVGAMPTALSQLTNPITTAQRNSCDRAGDVYVTGTPPAVPINPGYVNGWKGPYSTYSFVAAGTTQIAKGFTAQDDLVRVPANPVANPKGDEWAGRLQIVFPSVTQLDAQALDAAVDLTISGTAGTVRYAATDPTALQYEIRVSRC
ncbi:MAG TPA: prepilin-type N-terminal cleavage/methylation domain-containing protein [Gemmatimonadaceae bacterium]|nr:prepilin-type N-terminal cleavage/methylation domain-containing protein [Gemmatimonadaceae bacterium]